MKVLPSRWSHGDGVGLIHDVEAMSCAVALVVLFDRVAFRDLAELRENDARGVVIHDAADIVRRNDAEFFELRIEDVPERHQVGAGFFERGEIFLEIEGRLVRELRAEFAGAMPDDFMHGSQQFVRLRARISVERRFFGRETNSSIMAGPGGLRRARALPVKRKLFEPYLARISSSLGRLSPVVVTWKSPVSAVVSTAFATGGFTPCFL